MDYSTEIKHVFGVNNIKYNLNEFVVCCLVRNGELLIKSFIEHYFNLGAKHIIFIDNDSNDNTISIASSYDNVSIFKTDLPYKNNQYILKQFLIENFCKNRWSILVDIDEFFDFPFSNKIKMSSLLSYLNRNSFTAVVGYMLDMFSDKSLFDLKTKKEDNVKDIYRYYDIINIEKVNYYSKGSVISNHDIKTYYGGICKTVFNIRMYLNKHPLVFCDEIIKPQICSHDVLNAKIADFSCVLYHYRFISSYCEKLKDYVERKCCWKDSIIHKQQYDIIKTNPKIIQETSKLLYNVDQLIDDNFLVVSDKFMKELL